MGWEKIEERLKRSLRAKVSFSAGTVWLPDHDLSIDEWLVSIAETDEELRELDMPRIRFLQNRWPMEKLFELEGDDEFSNRRVVLAMYVGLRAYVLFSGWNQYHVVAAIEPKDKASLYQVVVSRLMENRSLVRVRPTRINN